MAEQSNLNGRVLQATIDFDLIVNTELGLIRFIRENFQDERAFVLDMLNKSDREILSLLYSRKNPNPLSIISTDENLKDIDDLYKSFFDNYKKEIIDLSVSEPSTIRFIEAISTSGNNFGVNGSIAVSDDLEKDEILSHFQRISIIYKNNKSQILSKDPYYIKDYRFFTDIGLEDKILGKKIYMSPRQYNIDYFENETTCLTTSNVYILFGKDFRKTQGEK